MYKLAPSLLAADFGIIKEQLAKLDEAKVPYLHLDIMDGVFVPNLSFGLAVVESIRKYTKMVFVCICDYRTRTLCRTVR